MPITRSRRRLAMVAGSVSVLSFVLVGGLNAKPYSAVEVRGAEFIAGDSITASCGIESGVSYSATDLRDFEDCLMSSGQFRSVRVSGEGDTLVVAVREANDRPGRVELGFSYDTLDGLTGSFYLERYNVFPGVFGALDLRVAEEAQSLQGHLYRADAFGDLDFGIDMLALRTEYDNQGFRGERTWIEPYLAWPFSEKGRVEIGLGYRRDEMSDVSADASALTRAEAGSVDAPFLRLGLRYASNPAESSDNATVTGLSVSLDQYFWGLGGDTRISETRLDAETRFALGEGTALLIGLRGGLVSAEGGGSTRGIDRLYVGGADFRGFAPRGLGPKDGSYFLGGNKYYVASVEVQRDMNEVFGTPARIGIFAEAGSVWDLNDTLGGGIDDSRRVRSSVGLSMTLDIGSVPVSLYVARPIDKVEGDKTQAFGISLSTQF